MLKKRRRAADKIAKKESRSKASECWSSPSLPSKSRQSPYRSRSPSPEDRGISRENGDFTSPPGRPRRPQGTNGSNSPDWELNLSDDDDEGVAPSPESKGASIIEDDEVDDNDVTPREENIHQSLSPEGNDNDNDQSAGEKQRAERVKRNEGHREARNEEVHDNNGDESNPVNAVDDSTGEEAFGDDSGDFLADDASNHRGAADSDEEEGRVELDLSDGEDDDGVWPQASPHAHHHGGRAQDKEEPEWFKSGGVEEGHYDEEEDEDTGAPTLSLAENRAQLAELEDVAKTSAKKAASLAHITIQWSKVVEEVRRISHTVTL